MRRIILAGALAALLPLAPLPAAAQEAAPQLQEDPRAPRFREVERGLHVGLETGFLGILKTPVAEPASHPYACPAGSSCSGGFASGLALVLDVGYDVTSTFDVSLFLLQAFESASRSYGSFAVTAPGAGVRWSFLGERDANGVERFYAFARARVAYAWTYPEGLFGTTDVVAGAGLGIDYYTRLRHFSVGLAADGLYFIKVNVPAFDVVATLRYTF
jgi:hypothetical protein